MTYNLPKEVILPPEYTDKATNIYARMALYFDLNIYKEHRNDALLYQYLYHIVYMLACTMKYFNTWTEYDEFALFMATKVFLRYINPKHQGEEDRLKSVLNYCKSLLYPTKCDFQKETFNEIIGKSPKSGDADALIDVGILDRSFRDSVQSSHLSNAYELLREDLCDIFSKLPKSIMDEINKTPFTTDKVFTRRLYMSVLLTILKGITVNNSASKKLKNKEQSAVYDELLYQTLLKERTASVTLWKIENKYANLVNSLAVKVRKNCGKIIGITRKEYELSDEDVEAVIMSAYGNTLRDDNEEF